MNEDFYENTLPSSDESEQVCLGSILLDNEVIDQCIKYFGPEDLYSTANKYIYQAMLHVKDQGQSIDPVTVHENLKANGIKHIQVTTIANLTFGIPHFSNIEEHAKIVKKHSLSRQAIKLANSVTRDLMAGDVDPVEVIGKLERRAMQLSTKLNADRKDDPEGFASASELTPVIRAQFEAYHRGEASGVETGMKPLDVVLDGGGLQKKGTYVIGGREKSGKTSLALDWIENIVLEQNKTALIVTLEMSKETMLKRLYSKHTGIPYYMFRPGFYDTELDNPYTRAIEGLDAFSRFPFKIADNLFTMEAIYRHCVKQIELGQKENNHEVGVIMLDYLQIIGLEQGRMGTTETVTKISRQVKILASDLNVPVIIMSNLNRAGLNEEGQEPDVHNLRDSGSIAFDAEAVVFVHNPAYIPGKPYEQREITDYMLILSRQRNGPSKRIPLKFIGPYMQFMTEEQYMKQYGPGIPLSMGQMKLKQESINNLWEEDDEDWK